MRILDKIPTLHDNPKKFHIRLVQSDICTPLRQTSPSSLCPPVATDGGVASIGVVRVGGLSARCVGDSFGCVVLEQRLKEHSDCAKDTHKHKDPKEQTIDHHGNVLPVLTHL